MRYLGEVAAMDGEMGRLITAFEASASRRGSSPAVIVAGDHGEGLGDHGELQHGNLLYQSTMHVPLLVMGPGVAAGTSDTPVSTRRIFFTVLDWAGLESAHSLRASESAAEVVLGEAMKPYLGYGWQPQIMAVSGRQKAIFAGTTEVYDLLDDPGEARISAPAPTCRRALRKALDDYPVPSPEAARAPESLSDEARRNLASLGYVSGSAPPVVRKDAPRPVDMVGLFEILEKASGLFVNERYAEVIPLLERIRAADPNNLDAAASARHRALVTRPRGAGARGVQGRGGDRAAVARCPHLPRAALRAREGLAAGRASARARCRRDAGSAAGG